MDEHTTVHPVHYRDQQTGMLSWVLERMKEAADSTIMCLVHREEHHLNARLLGGLTLEQ
jgi:hypothetical protein